ncbi:FAD-binding protein [Nitriliruptoraceae bacterium ZYF776]|nr:FAD-binding protein [Profundirhabdus halotolerans]
MAASWRNWAGNASCRPRIVERPRDEGDVVAAIAAAGRDGRRVRVVGTGHSFTPLAVTDDTLLDVAALRGLRHLDEDGTATFGAGTPLHEASELLAAHGRAFENLGDIAVQTVAGAVGTGTHGTGARFGNLSSTVVGGRLVTAAGEVLDVDGDLLPATQVSLGALGVLTEVRVRTVPAFTLEAVEAVRPVDEVLADLDDFVDGVDHAEFFWFPGSEVALTKRNARSQAPPAPRGRLERLVGDELVGNLAFGTLVRACERVPRAVGGIHAVLRRLPESRFAERSDQVFASPRRVRFVEMEQSVPREAFPEAFARLRAFLERDGRAVPFPVECRWVAGDDAYLSPAHGGPRAYLAVHLSPRRHDPSWFAAIEELWRPLGARPHWGKLHTRRAADLAPAYPRWADFQAVRRELDPTGVFGNVHLDRVLGALPRTEAAA